MIPSPITSFNPILHLSRRLPLFLLVMLACMLPSTASAFGSTTTVCPWTGSPYSNTFSSFTFSKTGPATAAPGSLITYRFTITQHAPNACGTYLLQWGEKIVDIAPAGLRLIGAPNDNFIKCDPLLFPTILRCDVYGPKSQGTMTFDAVFEVSPDLPCGTVIKNQATMTYPKESLHPQNTGTLTSETTTVITGGNCTSSSSSSSVSSSSSSVQSSSSSAAPVLGCIDVLKETYDTQSAILTPVTQFTFQLDGQRTAYNNGNGLTRFENVTPGSHTVTETVPAGWTQLNVTPVNGTVIVAPGSNCAVVTFKNKQVLPPASSSSSSSSSSVPMTPYVHPQCSDGLDNDGDGKTDFFDPGCYPNNVFNPVAYNPNDNSEVNAAVLCRWIRTNNQWVRTCS